MSQPTDPKTALDNAVSKLETDYGVIPGLQSAVTDAQTAATNAAQGLTLAQNNLTSAMNQLQEDIQAVKDAATAFES